MNRLHNQHGWYKNQFFMGGGPSGGGDVPAPPPPPPPPAPPPTKTDEDVQQEKRGSLERKKFAKGREKTLLAQTGAQGSKKKKTLLGE